MLQVVEIIRQYYVKIPVIQSQSVSGTIQVTVEKRDVIKNPDLMGIWILQNLSKNNLLRIEGCGLAIKTFGNNKPFSNSKIYNLKCMQEFRDTRKQKSGRLGAKHHWEKEPSKKDILKKLAIKSKSELKGFLDESENSSMVFTETLSTLLKEY